VRLEASASGRMFFLIFFFLRLRGALRGIMLAIENAIEKNVFQSHNRIVLLQRLPR
jgi:hypothetical protein